MEWFSDVDANIKCWSYIDKIQNVKICVIIPSNRHKNCMTFLREPNLKFWTTLVSGHLHLDSYLGSQTIKEWLVQGSWEIILPSLMFEWTKRSMCLFCRQMCNMLKKSWKIWHQINWSNSRYVMWKVAKYVSNLCFVICMKSKYTLHNVYITANSV